MASQSFAVKLVSEVIKKRLRDLEAKPDPISERGIGYREGTAASLKQVVCELKELEQLIGELEC